MGEEILDEQMIDRQISRNNTRAERFQKMIDRFTERKQRFVDDNATLATQKAQILAAKEALK